MTSTPDYIRPLLDAGYTQAQLARMFDADTATTHQWVHNGRIGELMVGRVQFIPELKNHFSVEQLRPDLPPHRVKATIESARIWWNEARKIQRVKEVPGVRANNTAHLTSAAKKALRAAAAKNAPAKRAATTTPRKRKTKNKRKAKRVARRTMTQPAPQPVASPPAQREPAHKEDVVSFD